MNSILLPIGVVVCAAAGATLWFWPADATAGSAPAPEPVLQQPVAPAETPEMRARWTAPPTVKNPDAEAKRHMVKLPTGEYVRALNGAVDAKPLEWMRDRPYSPIIGIDRAPDGKDWWVHADGSRSTTEMVYRSDLGRPDAVTQVAHPAPALPFHPEDLGRMRGEGENKPNASQGGEPPAPKKKS
jgi:hypothetical protein